MAGSPQGGVWGVPHGLKSSDKLRHKERAHFCGDALNVPLFSSSSPLILLSSATRPAAFVAAYHKIFIHGKSLFDSSAVTLASTQQRDAESAHCSAGTIASPTGGTREDVRSYRRFFSILPPPLLPLPLCDVTDTFIHIFPGYLLPSEPTEEFKEREEHVV
ncbi:unnamed protein product [Pleuronectes platessa]|uniref:Uncharacterized protein n=1 Tax=Pleuronectes platessa TaxID=8262 RepID=A0A9N7UXQ6_PLEPL|nr:unnamed protein product [Pleuronectes platessa]